MFNEFPKNNGRLFQLRLCWMQTFQLFSPRDLKQRYGNPWLLGNPTKSFTFSPVFFSLRVAMVQFLMFRENHYQQRTITSRICEKHRGFQGARGPHVKSHDQLKGANVRECPANHRSDVPRNSKNSVEKCFKITLLYYMLFVQISTS